MVNTYTTGFLAKKARNVTQSAMTLVGIIQGDSKVIDSAKDNKGVVQMNMGGSNMNILVILNYLTIKGFVSA